MKLQYLLLFLFIIISQNSFSAKISGKIVPSEAWRNMVYVSEIKEYDDVLSGNNSLVVESQILKGNGNFTFDNLSQNSIYRVSVVPKDNLPGMIIQNGKSDNYAFVITGKNESLVFIEGDISRLFLSYSILASTAELSTINQKIVEIRKNRLPLFEKMQSLDLSTLDTIKDQEKLVEYQMSLFQEIKSKTEQVNDSLFPILLKEENPNLLSITAAFSQVEMASKNKKDAIVEHINKIYEKSKAPILYSILIKLEKSRHIIKPDFLFASSYKLISGEKFSFFNPIIESKILLWDFWASWCVPCRKAITTDLKYLSHKYPKEKLKIIGVIVNDEIEAAKKAIKNDKNNNIQISDLDNYLFKYFNIENIPYYVIINQETQEILPFNTFFEVREYINHVLK